MTPFELTLLVVTVLGLAIGIWALVGIMLERVWENTDDTWERWCREADRERKERT